MQSENHGADTRLGVNELTDIEPVIGQLKNSCVLTNTTVLVWLMCQRLEQVFKKELL